MELLLERSSDDERSIKTGKERQVLIESTRAEMVEVREENRRLKTTLSQIIKDYESLQKHFSDVSHQQLLKKPAAADAEGNDVSLSLGTSSSGGQNMDDKVVAAAARKINNMDRCELEGSGAQLTLGLTCSKFEGSSSSNSSDTAAAPKKEVQPAEVLIKPEDSNVGGGDQPPWAPSRTALTLKSSAAGRNGHGDDDGGDEDEASASKLQPQAKRARVSVRTRCDGPTLNDGCQWRKYGQKISKGNPCPRAYYRCTVAPACPVRKQVQRCAEDMSILITTYEGTHNHPLSVSASAMASTTAAAATMLMSGSSSSQPAASAPLNFLSSYSSPPSSYLPNSSSASSHPTVTLDLTSPPQTQYFNRLSLSSKHQPPTTSFSFSSPEIPSSLPSSWSHGPSYNFSNYGAQPYYRSSIGRQSSYLQKTPLITDTIAKVITADPKFQSALTAAISSYVEARGVHGGERHQHGVQYLGAGSSSLLSAANGGCAASFQADRPPTTGLSLNTQGSPLMKSSMGFPGTVSSTTASASPEDISRGN